MEYELIVLYKNSHLYSIVVYATIVLYNDII